MREEGGGRPASKETGTSVFKHPGTRHSWRPGEPGCSLPQSLKLRAQPPDTGCQPSETLRRERSPPGHLTCRPGANPWVLCNGDVGGNLSRGQRKQAIPAVSFTLPSGPAGADRAGSSPAPPLNPGAHVLTTKPHLSPPPAPVLSQTQTTPDFSSVSLATLSVFFRIILGPRLLNAGISPALVPSISLHTCPLGQPHYSFGSKCPL